MKKLSMAVAISLVMFSACSEGKVEAGNVPEAAKSAFASKYPGATGVEWKTETSDGKKVWEAKFKQNGEEIEAEFDEAGNFVKED